MPVEYPVDKKHRNMWFIQHEGALHGTEIHKDCSEVCAEQLVGNGAIPSSSLHHLQAYSFALALGTADLLQPLAVWLFFNPKHEPDVLTMYTNIMKVRARG